MRFREFELPIKVRGQRAFVSPDISPEDRGALHDKAIALDANCNSKWHRWALSEVRAGRILTENQMFDRFGCTRVCV